MGNDVASFIGELGQDFILSPDWLTFILVMYLSLPLPLDPACVASAGVGCEPHVQIERLLSGHITSRAVLRCLFAPNPPLTQSYKPDPVCTDVVTDF